MTRLGPDMDPLARTSNRWAPVPLLMLALFLLLTVASPTTARADEFYEPPPLTPGSNAVGSCLEADQVWLLVVDVDEVLANQCVGTPASGEEALARGGMQIRFGSGRLICSLSGHPEKCPATFTGSYWNYHHGRAGEPYTYSKDGAATHRPEPGSIEAWCYNGDGEKSCTPPLLTVLQRDAPVNLPAADASDHIDPAPTANVAVPLPSTTPWALLGTGAIIAVGISLLLWWRRRAGPIDDQVGGR